MAAIDFHGIFIIAYAIQWLPNTVQLLSFFKICYFVLNRRKNKFGTTWCWVNENVNLGGKNTPEGVKENSFSTPCRWFETADGD